jgi:pseudaminic acid synthase
MPQLVKIGSHEIGPNRPPLFVAEMSGNHNNSLIRALEIVDAAALSGANALKIQTYTPDSLTIDSDRREFLVEDSNSPWFGKSLYELYSNAMTPYEWHLPIYNRCKEKGLIFLSTPFDISAIEFLEQFDPPAYKVASFENSDLDLLTKVANTGKPVIISTGLATFDELKEAVSTVRGCGISDIILLKCTSTYPADPLDANINTIPSLSKALDVNVGLSDHTLGIGVALGAIALGSCLIEKHLTLSRHDGGVDSSFSLEPTEFKQLTKEGTDTYRSLGAINYGPTNSENASMVFRRSLYIVEDISKGGVLSSNNLRCIRPGYGLPPKFYRKLLGRKINRDLPRGTAMSEEYLES